MLIEPFSHLTYCSNIHPGESWNETFANLKTNIPAIKKSLDVSTLGLGLRLSDLASRELTDTLSMNEFLEWLEESDTYVFTMNGFPYGGFHNRVIKEDVHRPDWLSTARVAYTLRLFELLDQLLPMDIDGGISTSPVSYKYWHTNHNKILQQSVPHVMEIVYQLWLKRQNNGKLMHLDIEPEPDGMLENTREFVNYFNDHLLRQGLSFLAKKGVPDPENCIREHVQLCYDVCHFAVEYETPQQVISTMDNEGIKIGKMQISAALKAEPKEDIISVRKTLEEFNEPTYLHQAIIRRADHFEAYKDLDKALLNLDGADELRTHFHVPVFLENYGRVQSTQQDILTALDIWNEKHYTSHLEVETYTWNVLPEDMKLPIDQSIARELLWVRDHLK